MAGFTPDPAVERWYKMRETTHLYFRPTGKNIAIGTAMLIITPLVLYKLIDEGNVEPGILVSSRIFTY